MITLPNNCYCSDFSVFPKDWDKAGATTKMNWRIQYYFHDPRYKDDPKYKYGLLCVVKGMNKFKTLSERRDAVKKLMENELALLKQEEYNPIAKTRKEVQPESHELAPQTPFIKALTLAMSAMKCEHHTLEDVRSVLKYVAIAAQQLSFDLLPVVEIRRKHIRQLLDHCGKIKKKWSANTFNYYRAYLSLVFRELVELEAIEYNPVKEIAKRKTTKKLRQVLSEKERQKVNEHLMEKVPLFHRFINIFFHSGGRIGEMLRLKGKDINLQTQKYKCLIKKGKAFREVERTIKDVALPYWMEALHNCGKEEIIFSEGLVPGKTVIRPEQITRRWKRHVKEDLGIDADFYSLKHLNTDETAALLGINDAAAHNSHTSTVITMKHYALGEKERQHERLKKVENKFA